MRVAVVDDHELVAMAVEALCRADPDIGFDHWQPTVAALTRRPRSADLVLLDLHLGDGTMPTDNVTALERWGAKVLILTSGENAFLVREASRTTALGIVRKSAASRALIDAIHRVRRDEPVATPEWASALDSDPELPSARLTERERTVLALYASGLGAKEVAARLFVSENTVNDHLRRIKANYQRLGRPAPTKVELYQRGIEDGYVPAPQRG